MEDNKNPEQTELAQLAVQAQAENQSIEQPPTGPGSPTTPANKNIFKALFILIVALISLIVLIVTIGLQTNNYETAKNYNFITSLLGLVLAISIGALFAYTLNHPRRLRNRRTSVRYLLLIVGFLFGAVPGIILAIIITFPLSDHACRLSGSKFC